MIYVCPLSRLEETVAAAGARHLVSLVSPGTRVRRPSVVHEDDHLFLGMNDVVNTGRGFVSPAAHHLASLVEFATGWDRRTPMVIHCQFGISRSTAAAFIVAALRAPERDEAELARALRRAAPSATPNPLLVSIADTLLRRDGRMTAAIAAIGRGAEASEGTPFVLKIDG